MYILLGTKTSIVSVSYTHLDVYKRQVKVDVPLFRNLKENVNYADATRDLIITARNSKPRV